MSYGIEITSPDGYHFVVDGYSCFKYIGKVSISLPTGTSSTTTATSTIQLSSPNYLAFFRHTGGTLPLISMDINSNNLLTIECRTTRPQSSTTPSGSVTLYIFSDYKPSESSRYGIEVYDENGKSVFDPSTKALSATVGTKSQLPLSVTSPAVMWSPFRGVGEQYNPILMGIVYYLPIASGNSIAEGAVLYGAVPGSIAPQTYHDTFLYIDTTLYD